MGFVGTKRCLVGMGTLGGGHRMWGFGEDKSMREVRR